MVLPTFSSLTPVKTGTVSNFDLSPARGRKFVGNAVAASRICRRRLGIGKLEALGRRRRARQREQDK